MGFGRDLHSRAIDRVGKPCGTNSMLELAHSGPDNRALWCFPAQRRLFDLGHGIARTVLGIPRNLLDFSGHSLRFYCLSVPDI